MIRQTTMEARDRLVTSMSSCNHERRVIGFASVVLLVVRSRNSINFVPSARGFNTIVDSERRALGRRIRLNRRIS